MNTITDKIFLAVFSGFILTITTASVVVAQSITPPGGEAYEIGWTSKQVEEVEAAPAVPQPITPPRGEADEIGLTSKQVQAAPAVPLLALTDEQLRFLINELRKPEPAKNMPLWKKSCMWTWKALSTSYNVLMKIPAGAQIVLAIAKYKPEWLGLALKEGAKAGVGVGVDVTAKVGEDVAESIVKAIEKNTSPVITEPVRHVVEEAAKKHAEWAENSSVMQRLACWAGYGCEMPPLN